MVNQMTLAQQNAQLTEVLYAPERIKKLNSALSGWISAEDFLSQIIITLSDEKYAECSVASKVMAVYQCSTMALLPAFKQVAIIPRNVKKKGPNGEYWEKEVQVMPQWQGFKALMERHPAVLEVKATLIHAMDAYNWNDGEIVHEYDPFTPGRSFTDLEKTLVGGYLVATFTDGRPRVVFPVTAEYILKSRDCSDTWKKSEKRQYSPWTTWTEEMALKTVYRAAYSKQVTPVDPIAMKAMKAASEVDDAVLGNQLTAPEQPTRQMLARPQQSRTNLLANQVRSAQHADQQFQEQPEDQGEIIDAEPPQEEQKPKGKKPKPAETSDKPEYGNDPLLSTFDDSLSKCTSTEQIDGVFGRLKNEKLDHDQFDTGGMLVDWHKARIGKGKQKPLIDE